MCESCDIPEAGASPTSPGRSVVPSDLIDIDFLESR